MQTQPIQPGAAFAMFSSRAPAPTKAANKGPGFEVEADKSPPGEEASSETKQTEKKLLGKGPNARLEKPDSLNQATAADRSSRVAPAKDDIVPEPKLGTSDPSQPAPAQPQAAEAVLAQLVHPAKLASAIALVATVDAVAVKATAADLAGPPPADTAPSKPLPADIAISVPPSRDPNPKPPVQVTKGPRSDDADLLQSDLSSDEVASLGIKSVKAEWSTAPVAGLPAQDISTASLARDEAILSQDTAPKPPQLATDDAHQGLARDDYTGADMAGTAAKAAATDDAAPAADTAGSGSAVKGGKVHPMPAESLGKSHDEAGLGARDDRGSESSDNANQGKGSSNTFVDAVQSKAVAGAKPVGPVVGPDTQRSVDRVAVVRQVADRIELLAATPRNGVTVRLEPADLGSITLVVKSHGDDVDTHILASHEAVRGALDGSRTQMREALEARGLHLGSMTVGQDPSKGQAERETAAHTHHQHRAFAPSPESVSVSASTDWRTAARSSHGTDLWI